MIGEQIQARITELNLTQAEAAEKLGITQSRLNLYINDKREPNCEFIMKICETFDISPNYLFNFNVAQAFLKEEILEETLRYIEKYKKENKKDFSAEKLAHIIPIIYEVVLTEENPKKTIEWVIEAANK